ncbi:MAG: hypothetical protein MUE46_12005 [Xanthomonadales bacterium]|jgi:tetratricopeptide (TPR) repeat protein|nr:hypothetical protein [Xanthomonadales bacterium]
MRLIPSLLLALALYAPLLPAQEAEIREALRNGKIDQAVTLAEAWTESAPQDSKAWSAYGNAYGRKATSVSMFRAMGMAGDIREAFQKAVELDPRNMDAQFGLMGFYLAAPAIAGGGIDKAKDQARAIARVDAAQGERAQAQIAFREKREADGKQHLAKARELGADNLDLQLMLHSTAIGLKQMDDAAAILAHLQTLAPEDLRVRYQQAVWPLRVESGDFAASRDALAALIASPEKPANISDAVLHWRLGQAQEKAGDTPAAVTSWKTSTRLDPEFKEAQADLKRVGA